MSKEKLKIKAIKTRWRRVRRGHCHDDGSKIIVDKMMGNCFLIIETKRYGPFDFVSSAKECHANMRHGLTTIINHGDAKRTVTVNNRPAEIRGDSVRWNRLIGYFEFKEEHGGEWSDDKMTWRIDGKVIQFYDKKK